MKRPFFSISARLLLINVCVLLFMVGVVSVMFLSFDDIEQMMDRILQRDVVQVISNASIGRPLSDVFADTSHLLDRFLDENVSFLQEGERLIQEISTVIEQPETAPEMVILLKDFLHTLQERHNYDYVNNSIARAS